MKHEALTGEYTQLMLRLLKVKPGCYIVSLE